MRRRDRMLVLLSGVVLAGCQASSASIGALAGSGNLSLRQPSPITIPEGATLPLILETAMSSATSRPGDRVNARLALDVLVGDEIVVPAGTEVHGTVTSALSSGHADGLAHLAFDFDTLVLGPSEHPIVTRSVEIRAETKDERDAAIIEIGTVPGALLGAARGSGLKGIVGWATGTGVVLNYKGREVELCAGTRVTVRLTRQARL